VKYLAGFLGFLAVVAIVLTTVAWVIDDSLLSATYLNQQANRASFYDNLADTLPEALSRQAPNPGATKTALEIVITAETMQSQLTPWFEQIEAYYKHNGPVPQLQFKDLAEQAQLYQVPLPPGPPLDQPLTWQDPGLKLIADRLVVLKTVGAPIALGLLFLIFILSKGWQRQMRVAKTLVVAAFMVGGLYLLAKTLPGLASSALSGLSNFQTLAPGISKFVTLISEDLAVRFGQIAIGLVTGAALLFPLAIVAKLSGKVGRHGEAKVKEH
jgi:hypothetical protein